MKNTILIALMAMSLHAGDKYECASYTRLGDLQVEAVAKAINDGDYIDAMEHLKVAKYNYFKNGFHCPGREHKLDNVNKLLFSKDFKNLVNTQKNS